MPLRTCSAQTKSLCPVSDGSTVYQRERFDLAEVEWRVVHASFADVLEKMQLMVQLMSESHVSQQLAAHRCVQREKVLRLLVEAQLHEREEMDTAHTKMYKLLDQKHQELRTRYLELTKSPNMYCSCTHFSVGM
jgi:hypothetical protein